MKSHQKDLNYYTDIAILLLVSILFISFPLIFTPLTTDPFVLPKQLILGMVTLIGVVLWGLKMFNNKEVAIRKTPFDIPIIIFNVALLLSAFLSMNQSDALTAVVPVLLATTLYFLIVNQIKKESGLLTLLYMLLSGGAALALFSLLNFFQIYILPFSYTHARTFTPIGTLLDQALYLGFLLPFGVYFSYNTLLPTLHNKKSVSRDAVIFGILSLVIAAGFVGTLFELFTIQKPTILPFNTGFQVGFAAISQDATRLVQSFLFGSGYGTFITDFTRFKTAVYNTNPTLWSFTFFRSSSFALELLATGGIMGIISLLYLLYTVLKNKPKKSEGTFGLYLSIVVAFITAFILPFSFIPLILLIILLALFSITQGLVKPQKVYDVALTLVALRKTLGMQTTAVQEKSFSSLLPGIFLLLLLAYSALIGYNGIKYALADQTFEASLVAAAANQGKQTYDLQNNAINTFSARDAFYRSFSQTNLALANSLAASVPKNSTPSAQEQQTISTLVQQSISSAKQAISIAPLTVLNWQNLASIYRSLIGFGQNADQFAIAASQQAIILDPTNPQEYIDLGGIYYQLGQWDNAIAQFSQAVSLKPDFANAHYNLGHAYEAKNDLQDALTQYQAVDVLTVNDKVNNTKIKSEIAVLQKKIGSSNQNGTNTSGVAGNQPPLGVTTPAVQLPQQQQPVKIPAPSAAVSQAPKSSK